MRALDAARAAKEDSMKSLDAELVCSKRRACLLARRRQGAAVAEMCAAIHDDDVCACLCLALVRTRCASSWISSVF